MKFRGIKNVLRKNNRAKAALLSLVRAYKYNYLSGCRDFAILYEATDFEEGQQAERLAISYLLNHNDDTIHNNIKNAKGGSHSVEENEV